MAYDSLVIANLKCIDQRLDRSSQQQKYFAIFCLILQTKGGFLGGNMFSKS
jgi:hypothetical protein